jgi:hypothetical protein
MVAALTLKELPFILNVAAEVPAPVAVKRISSLAQAFALAAIPLEVQVADAVPLP